MTEEQTDRPTPYALVFDAPAFQDDFFPRIAADEQQFGAVTDTTSFLRLDSAQELLEAVLPEEATGPAAAPGRAPSGASAFVVDRYAALLFVAFRYWQAGRPLHAFDETVVRSLLAAPPAVHGWTLADSPASGYVQLPRNIVWSLVDEGEPPEPVDGFFWARTADAPATLIVVLALGVRAGRPGFSVLDASAPIPPAGHFADADGRTDDFVNFLPGGELQQLHGVRTPAEALRMASLCLWYLSVHPDAVTTEGGVHRVRALAQDG